MASILILEAATQPRADAASGPLLEAAIGALREPVRRFVSGAKLTRNFWDWVGDDFVTLEPLRVYADNDVVKAATLLETRISGQLTAREYGAA